MSSENNSGVDPVSNGVNGSAAFQTNGRIGYKKRQKVFGVPTPDRSALRCLDDAVGLEPQTQRSQRKLVTEGNLDRNFITYEVSHETVRFSELPLCILCLSGVALAKSDTSVVQLPMLEKRCGRGEEFRGAGAQSF